MPQIPADPSPASEYIKLGERINILRNLSTNTRLYLALSELESFIEVLKHFGFTYPQQRFQLALAHLQQLHENAPPVASLTAEQAESLRKLIDPIAEVILNEAEKRQTI